MKNSFYLLRSLFGTRRRRHRGGRRPIQKSTLGRFETLESRHLLTSHALATVTGVVGTVEAEVTLNVADNSEPVVLGIMIQSADGSPLDPLAPRVVKLEEVPDPIDPTLTETQEFARPPAQSADNHNGTTSGYATVQLEAGEYRIYVGGEADTAGAFVLDVTIPGDMGQDGVVGQDELQWTAAAMLQQQDWGNHFSSRMFRGLGIDPTIDLYRAEVDANGDGTIDGFDVAQVAQNSQAGTVAVEATAEVIQARLEQELDTGRSDSDGITNDPGAKIVGSVANSSAITSLTGQIDDGTQEDLFDLFGQDFVVDGDFALTVDDLATIAGGADLVDTGGYTLTLRALDGAGNELQDPVEVTFEFDTVAPVAPSVPDLVVDSDSGADNEDNVTNVNTPTFEVDHVDADVLVRLFTDPDTDPIGEATTASPVTITSTQLADGDYQIIATGTDVAGNESDASAALPVTIDTAAPTAIDDSYAVDENGTPVSGNVVTDNTGGDVDSDAGSPPVTFVSFDDTNTAGTVTDSGNGDGGFTYDPHGQFESLALDTTGTDSFDYTIEDGAGNQATGTVTITISGENDTPVAADVSVNTNKDDPSVNGSFDAADADRDDAPGDLVYTITSSPAEGSVTNNDDGTFTFLPGTDFQDLGEGQSRDVSFTYTAEDSHGAVSDSATVTITVAGFNTAPTFAEVETVTLKAGSPLHIPLDGFDLESQTLTYEVTANTNSALVATSFPESASRGMRVTVDGFAENPSEDGEMVYRLYEQRVPDITDRMIAVAEAGSYDGSTFHRVIDAFVIQGGIVADGSSWDEIDDQYHEDIQHNRTGTLSTAKSDDDTNTTQFFVMEINPAVDPDSEGKARRLDFNHSIFGVQIEGDDVRERISNASTTAVMKSVEIFTDHENDVLMLKAPEGASGTADITVTVTDSQGKSFSRTFRVNVEPDNYNGGPFLEPIPEVRTTVDTPVEFTLTAIDVEGDPVEFTLEAQTTDSVVTINKDTGLVTATPPPDDTDFFQIIVGVKAVTSSGSFGTTDPLDEQLVNIFID